MSARRASTRVLSMLLVLFMVVGMMPMNVFAAETDTLAAALEETKTFIDGLTVNSSSNDPEKVVTTVGTHFSWDNEKRENGKKYLYEWSYYNGVVFEGLDYVYDVTGETAYYSYVKEYLDAMITDGALNSYAGYVDYHGADCYKTASLLLDYYKLTGDEKYLSVAETLYADLDAAAESYLLSDAGNNYHHTWASASSPALWLDGLYMILPFRAEYAAHIGDTEELDLIVDRLQWVSDNMYNEDKGLFYHAADSASSNSGTYWLRSIGWYAAAIADVMDSMSGDNLTAMQKQLKKLVDGMIAATSEDKGYMWLNNMAGSESSSNPYETSGTALVYYAVMKAVNNGWLDASYADYALDSFVYMCENKLENNVLTDICFKGAPGSSNSTFYDNEGKGVGPFIMLYAEVLEYYNNQEEEVPETTEPEVTEPEVTEPELRALTVSGTTAYAVGDELTFTAITAVYSDASTASVDVKDCTIDGTYDMNTAGSYSVTLTYNGVTSAAYWFTVAEPSTFTNNGVSVSGVITIGELGLTDNSEANAEVAAALGVENYVSYDITPAGTDVEGEGNVVLRPGNYATVSVTVDPTWENVKCWYIPEEGEPEQVEGTLENGVFTFRTNHFSTWLLGTESRAADDGTTATNTGDGYLVGGTTYTLNTDGEIDTTKTYLIVNTGSDTTNGHALTNNSGSAGDTTVEISGGKITVEDDTNIAWTFSGSTSGSVGNNGYYLYPSNGSLNLYEGYQTNLTISNQDGGEYRLYRTDNQSRRSYVRYNDGWTGTRVNSNSSTTYSVYLYEYTGSSAGEEVTFTVTPASATILPEGTTTLSGTVTVAGETVNLSNCTITWTSSDTSKATVSGGTVTGVADGNANITATLSAVNGTALQENIVLTIPVIVQSKSLATDFTPVLTGNTTIKTTKGVAPDFSNIKYEVKYEGDSESTFLVVGAGLTIDEESYDIENTGYYTAKILFNGNVIGTVPVIVTAEDPYAGLDEATTFPEYPNDGAVRVDKTATHDPDAFRNTGVTHVELDVAGISIKRGVDVVLTIDISNSMAWKNGSTTDNMSDNKLLDVMAAIKEFAAIFLADNEEGSDLNNTITLVTFGGYDAQNFNPTADFIDATRILVSATEDIDIINEICNNTKFLNGNTASGSYDSYDLQLAYYDTTSQSVVTEHNANRGDTNYDFAFWQTEQAIIAGNLGAGTRDVHVLFMTDGCASNFNNTYYRTSTTALNPGTDDFCTGETDYRGSTTSDGGKGWTDLILESIQTNGGNIYAKNVYERVDGIYAIGFDMAYGSFSGIYDWNTDGIVWEDRFNEIVSKVVTDSNGNGLVPVTAASDTNTLNEFYTTLAHELKLAGKSAQATDTIGSDFTLQMAATSGEGSVLANYGITPAITVTSYELYTKETATSTDQIGTRTGNSTVLEKVTFNDDGTKAYSTVKGEDVNIMTINDDGSVIIEADRFTYIKDANGVETFTWNIGDITEDEIVLGFDVYLKNSLEQGGTPDDVYYTNEEATLEYIDINGDHATKTFPVPGVAWGGASTTIRFYLVNEEGEPVNHAGDVVPWANRVYVGDSVTVALNLNADLTLPAQTIEAAAHVPGTYFLYDQNASYTVQTASGDNNPIVGGITPSTPSEDAYKTTYDENGNAIKQTGEQTTRVIDHEATYYTWSIVGFGVRYDLTKEKITPLNEDKVVIDYGKAIQVDVLANETDAVDTSLYTMELVGFVKYDASTDINYIMANQGSATYTADNGQFSIVEGKVNFQPSRMISELQRVFAVIKVTEIADTTNYHYRYNTLTIIPATIMYYETDFATGVFSFDTNSTWDNDYSEDNSSNTPDSVQDTVAIGTDLYGADTSYADDNGFSNATSYWVEGQSTDGAADKTVTEFTFTGTGFDIISATGTKQGMIEVYVYSGSTLVKTVKVLNKSESDLSLYQIPVVSVELDSHGTYDVKISVNNEITKYTGDLAALNRGNEFCFDAVRIYNPIDTTTVTTGTDAEIAYNAYVADGEHNPQIIEVRKSLLSANDFDVTSENEGLIFVDRDQSNVEVGTYKSIGPNNEVYLVGDQVIGFSFTTGSVAPESIHIGAKSANGAAVTLKAILMNAATGATVETVTTDIKSSTVQFITLFGLDDQEDFLAANTKYHVVITHVVITNEGSGILSITDLKIAGSTASNVIEPTSGEDLLKTISELDNSVSVETEEEEPTFGVVSAEFTDDSAKRGETVTMVITTTEDVASVGVKNSNGVSEEITVESVEVVNGQKVWTVSFQVSTTGSVTYTAEAFNADGAAGTTVTDVINVTIR